ncbi:hypothetical protein Droror1_Dr00000090, partial [Drosera rotundifolia]
MLSCKLKLIKALLCGFALIEIGTQHCFEYHSRPLKLHYNSKEICGQTRPAAPPGSLTTSPKSL